MQFSVSIFLIIATLTIGKQIKHLINTNIGFEKDGIVVIETQARDLESCERLLNFYKNKTKGINEVLSISGTQFSLYREIGEGVMEINGIKQDFNFSGIYYDYFKTMGIKLIEGRTFSRDISPQNSIIVNREFVRQFKLENPVGTTIGSAPPYTTIIGVVDDFNYLSLRNNLTPVVHIFVGPRGWTNMIVKISKNNINKTVASLEKIWSEFETEKPFLYTFLSDDFEKLYTEERRWNNIVLYSSALAVLITCMGLIGITTITINRRVKEIGIRKVLGASVKQITGLIVKDFLWLVITGNLIIWPVSYYLMDKWLNGFAYRTNIDMGIFAFAGILSVVIAVTTIGIQSIKAATVNPVESLRNE